jgi:hypothetical protein
LGWVPPLSIRERGGQGFRFMCIHQDFNPSPQSSPLARGETEDAE